MENKQRKNTARRILSIKSKHDRFISGYVKAKHPEAYMEAEEFYMQLNKTYPDKRDLCKTIEFLRITAGVKNINEYYYRNKVFKRKEKNHTVDNMVLEIPLLNHNTLTNNQTEEVNVHANESPLVIPDSLYEDLVQELRNDPDLYAIFNDMNNVDLSQEHQAIVETIPEVENIPIFNDMNNVDLSQEHQAIVETIPEVENIPGKEHALTVENITDLIQELCEDPDTYNIFNSMDIDEQTPLERDLFALGY